MTARSLEEKVDSEDQIHSILRKMCENRCLVIALTGGRDSEPFRLRLNNYHDSDELLFELMASEAPPVSSRDDIKAAFTMEETRFEFRTQVTENSVAAPGSIRLKRPTVIWKIEKRNFYRVRLDNPPIPVQLSGANLPEKQVICTTHNLSEGGMCCDVPPGISVPVGSEVSRVSFSLPNGFEISVSGMIRWSSSSCDGIDTAQCGLEFGPLSRSAQLRLSDFIFMKQRDEIRRKRHL